MTYIYSKKEGWIGFCSICEQPFKPYYAMRLRKCDRKMKGCKAGEIVGWCECCLKTNYKTFYDVNIGEKMFNQKIIDGVITPNEDGGEIKI